MADRQEARSAATKLDVWWDDDGCWAQVGEQTYGPFEAEEDAASFVPKGGEPL